MVLHLAAVCFVCGSSSSVLAAELTQQELVSARTLYVAKCAKCHKLHDPAAYSEPEWQSWMAKMAKKARLKKDQQELLSQYLDTLRKPNARQR